MSKRAMERGKGTTSYVALLRGINNIGQKRVRMEKLTRIFKSTGFKNVKTTLASGNIVFETTSRKTSALVSKIEKQLEKQLGYRVNVLLRTGEELHLMVQSNPFSKIKITPRTKLLVTFLPEVQKRQLKVPYKSPAEDFTILKITGKEIYSIVYLLPNKRPYRIISILEKEFGNRITNRNWNTILKIVNA